MCLLACSVWVMRCTALLWRAILRPFRYGCSHIDSKWGHVSLSLLWHSVQLGFWNFMFAVIVLQSIPLIDLCVENNLVATIMFIILFKPITVWMWAILCRILSVPHNTMMDMNNVMLSNWASFQYDKFWDPQQFYFISLFYWFLGGVEPTIIWNFCLLNLTTT